MITYPGNKLQKVLLGGRCEQRNLPVEYTQVEYLENIGNSFILLDISGDCDFKIVAQANSVTTDNRTLICSTDIGVGGSFFGSLFNGKWGLGTGLSSYYVDIDGTTKVNAELSFTSSGASGSVNSLQIERPVTVKNNRWALFASPIGLFSFIGKVWTLEAYQNSILVCNLIPCRRNSDSVLGMYDTVSNTFLTNAGTGTFTAGADVVVPTPDNPIDIICNNGVIKVRNKSGLPSGYQLIEYLESDGNSYINLNETATIDCELGLDCYATFTNTGLAGNNQFYMGCRKSGCAAIIGAQPCLVYLFGDMSSSLYDLSFELDKRHKIVINNTGCYVDDTLCYSYSGTMSVTESTNHIKLFATSQSGDGVEFKADNKFKVYSAYIKKNGIYTVNVIPARRKSDNVLGMYDLINDIFYINSGSGTFTAGQDVNDLEIYTIGTQETITDNLGNTANAEMLLGIGDYKDIQSIFDGNITRNVGIRVLDGTENWNMMSTAYTDGTHRIYTNDFGYDLSTDGISTHFVNAPLEDRNLSTGQQGKLYYSALSFHLRATQFTSLQVAKQWLADQYANGTPVILIFPRATSTIEQVTPQQLTGTTVTQTAGSINNLPIIVDTHVNLKHRFITDSNSNLRAVNKIYKGSNLIWEENTIQLPYDAEIEFLESDGAQKIDTDYELWNVGIKAEIKILRTGNDGNESAYIGRTKQSGFDLYTKSDAGIGLWTTSGNSHSIDLISNSSLFYDKNEHTVIFEITSSSAFLEVDGNQYTTSISNTDYDKNDGKIQLFSHKGYYYAEGRIYYCKIWDNGVLVLDFIPVRVGQVGYMYDKVSRKLFGNSGARSFILGPDICLLSEFLELEYLESDGNQYINTHLEIGSCDFKITTWLNISFGFIHNNKSSGTFITADTTNRTDSIWYEYDGYNNGVINNVSLNTDTKISYDMQNGLFVNDVKVASFLSAVKSDSINGYGMPIGTKYDFNTNSFITATRNIHIILRRYIIEKSGTIVMDLIPVKRISDGTLGMYDLILGLFFTNNGTGTFIAGPYVLP